MTKVEVGPKAQHPLYLSFSAEINQNTVENLMAVFGQHYNQGVRDFYFLFSSPGGNVMNGINVYNYLRSLPIRLTIHNIGIVDSIANVIFLAAETRYAVKNSSFLFHGVGFDITQARFEEKQIKEKLEIIERDQKLIADIIADRTKLTVPEVEQMFLEAKTMTPEEALGKQIVSDIREAKIPEGAQVMQFVFQRK